MTAPWTPRERALREALEGVMELAKEWSSAASSLGHPLAGARERSAAIEAEEALEEHIAAALSDPPPPDPRVEALRLAEEALRPFASGGVMGCLQRNDYSVMKERIVDWHGPSDFQKARAALAAIAAAKGEK